MRALAAGILAMGLCAAVASAENWPRFRGATGQGVSAEKGLPTKWSATENVAWKVEIPGQGWSSPIVWGERVFVTTATDGGISCRVLCLDREDGKVLWNKEVFQQSLKRKETRNSYATPTPCTDGRLVYAVFGGGSIAALDFAGNIVWINRDVQFYSQHGLGVSPILYEDLLIIPFDGSQEEGDKRVGWKIPWDKAVILALDKKTGKEKWRGKRGLSRIAHVTPNVTKVGDKMQLISAAGDVIQGHDLATGELIWSAYAQGEGVVPSIVIGDGLVYSVSGFEKTTIRATRPDGRGDVTRTHIVWEQTANAPTEPSPIYYDGHLYVINERGMAMCLEGRTGKITWQQRIGGNHCASPILAEGRIYFLSDQAETTIIEASPAGLKVLGRNSLGERCQASMAVSDGRLFIRTEKNLYCIR
jgi:outer membrane protein assembly factor BamB